jgi:hypothetical protein
VSDAQSGTNPSTSPEPSEHDKLLDIVSSLSEDARRRIEELKAARKKPEGVKDTEEHNPAGEDDFVKPEAS